MRINPFVYGALVLSVFLGVIFAFRSAGFWSVSGKVDAQGNRIAPSASDVESIKGWMTIGEIATAYNVPLGELLAQFQLPAGTPGETPVKDLESETFSVSGLRDWLLVRMEGSVAPPDAVALPTETPPDAVAMPTETLTAPAAPAALQATPGAAGEEHIPADRRVNAKTTFQDLLDWGVPAEAIRQVIGGDLPSLATVVKDYVTAQGLEFSGVKAGLQAEVDKLGP